MIRPDLHLHSTYSDGVLTPLQLVETAAALGVTAMAITDHDIFGGADSLRGTALPIPVIPGVELSISDMRNLHLLGYGLTEQCPLRDRVKELAAYRLERAERMLQKLSDLGLHLSMEEISAGSMGTIGRAHMGRAMVAKGYVSTFQEAFDRYLAEGKPAYVPGKRLSMAEALPLMRQSGFVPVLAHPALLGKDDVTLRALLQHWKAQGLMGVEVYHPSLLGRTVRLERMARELGLMVTGGSDFHKEGDSHGTPGCICSEWQKAGEDFSRLMDAVRKEKNKSTDDESSDKQEGGRRCIPIKDIYRPSARAEAIGMLRKTRADSRLPPLTGSSLAISSRPRSRLRINSLCSGGRARGFRPRRRSISRTIRPRAGRRFPSRIMAGDIIRSRSNGVTRRPVIMDSRRIRAFTPCSLSMAAASRRWVSTGS